MVITCTGVPALDPARLRSAGRFAQIGPEVLRLDEDEVRQLLLVRSGAPADPATIDIVSLRTEGWAFGVDLAARALTRTASADDVLDDLDEVLDDVIEAQVLAQLPAAGREVIIRTSVSPEVPAGLNRAIMGEDVDWSGWVTEGRGSSTSVRMAR